MLFATTMEPMKIIIINPIEAHLLSSPSIESKMKVAAAPAITAKAILNQNSLSNFRVVSLFSCSVLASSVFGGSSFFEASTFSVGGISCFSSSRFSFLLESSESGVGGDFFFLCLANEISKLTVNSRV